MPVDATLDQRGALRWAALFHDAAKPQTRTVTAEGGVKFFGHDVQGARIAREVLERLHASQALRRFCEVLVREHLRLGFLIRQRPLDAPARAPLRDRHAALRLRLDRALARRSLRHARRAARACAACAATTRWRRSSPSPTPPTPRAPLEPVIRGDNLARRLGIRPGPVLGELIAAIEEELMSKICSTSNWNRAGWIGFERMCRPTSGRGS